MTLHPFDAGENAHDVQRDEAETVPSLLARLLADHFMAEAIAERDEPPPLDDADIRRLASTEDV